MEEFRRLQPFCSVPVSHQNLVGLLRAYRRPNDKIRYWVAKGFLIPLKRGVYVVSEKLCDRLPSPILTANRLYGPSYVSLEYALAHYGAIPEAVWEISSVTTRRGQRIETPLGMFSYTRVPLPYYAAFITSQEVEPGQWAIMALPEKALTDLLVSSPGLQLRSVRDAQHWLADIRVDEEWVAALNPDRLLRLREAGPKQESIGKLIKALPAYAV
jgi:hypothetical protein